MLAPTRSCLRCGESMGVTTTTADPYEWSRMSIGKRIKKWKRRGWPVCGDAWRRSHALSGIDEITVLPSARREVLFGHRLVDDYPMTSAQLMPGTIRIGMTKDDQGRWVSDEPLPVWPGVGKVNLCAESAWIELHWEMCEP